MRQLLQNPLLREPDVDDPKIPRPTAKAMPHPVYDQPDKEPIQAQFDRLPDHTTGKLPEAAEHLETARADVLAFTTFPKDA